MFLELHAKTQQNTTLMMSKKIKPTRDLEVSKGRRDDDAKFAHSLKLTQCKNTGLVPSLKHVTGLMMPTYW